MGPWETAALVLANLGLAGWIFYWIGRNHEREAQRKPMRFKCCDHCYHPVTGEHYITDYDPIKFVADTHTVPCNEDGCRKGREVANANA